MALEPEKHKNGLDKDSIEAGEDHFWNDQI